MYNGIGLATARGSGTNGHVQRNLSFVRQSKKDFVKYKTEDDLQKAEAINNRQPNEEILEHDRKRKIEIKCAELEDILESQNYSADIIAAKVQVYREKLMEEHGTSGLPKDAFGRYSVRETHQVAAAQQEKNAMLRSAFGISDYFVEGSSFDSDRKAKEELARGQALQKELDAQRAADAEKGKTYKLVRTPSRERDEPNNVTEKGVAEKPSKKPTTSDKSKDKKNEEKSKKSEKKSDKSRQKQSRKKRKSDSSSSSDSEDERKKKSRRKKRYTPSSSSSSSSSSDSSDSSSSNSDRDKKSKSKRGGKSKRDDRRSRRRRSTSSSSDSSSESDHRRSKHSRKRKQSPSDSDSDRGGKHKRK